MQVFLIEEAEKINKFKKFFNLIEIKQDKIIINSEVHKMNFRKKLKLVKEIKKILNLNETNKIIITNKLKQDKEFVTFIDGNEIDIIKGKKLFKILSYNIIEKICKINNIKKEEASIGITINDKDDLDLNIIEEITKSFKNTSIITNNINQFKNLQKKVFQEAGVILNITNNKKKALAKAELILNVDFPEENINKYVINDNSIIINLEEKLKIKKKRFNGKIINDYNIKLKHNSQIAKALRKKEYQNFDIKDLAEVYILNKPKEIDDIIICN